MSNTAMTPDQFFDELDKLFGTDDGYENHLKRIKELKKQNEQLEYELDEEKEEHENTKYDLEKLQGDLEPLDEMMDKIKEVTEYEHVVDYVNGLHQKNLELQEKLDEYKECAGDMTNVKVLVAQVAELEHALESTENYWKSKFENEESTNKMLNDAIINHTEILDELREYLSRFDGDEVEVFDKIVKGSTD